ncbi:flagellar hook assembly protein FlgD [Pseudomonas sp. SZMC_28357]|uniref:flagellar hook assembly protein FlgD n=1 Tax=Pseudomonas sp. SZMC_28357 TaxID=3074380 RepID=UPI002871FCB7|nr:flagellar hook assembly protein FlgD [Pseudomonas sp. SZMC_28357]MDR9753426.1 flagellar hook assembly protein FlgD [Pseudomonas sp. SZMC_28357]
MSVTDTTGGVSIKDVLANSYKAPATTNDAISSATSTATGSQTLGKDSFLKLLVTQLNNQNPLDPQDNGEFVAQLAQFSSLEGITTLNDSVKNISDAFGSSQALQASSLVGRSVIIKTDKTVVDTSKTMDGTVVVPESGDPLTVTINVKDADGKAVRSIVLEKQNGGVTDFKWDGKNEAGEVAPAGSYTFTATTTIDSQSVALDTYLPATVNSVTMIPGEELMLNLAGLGKVGISNVQTIGK